MTIVLDVSAAIQIVLKKEKREQFEEIYRKASWVIAPALYISEITNVFWKYYRNKYSPMKNAYNILKME
jgi:predicted nucleic acid-binding protein